MKAVSRAALLAVLAASCVHGRPLAPGERLDLTLPRLGGPPFSFREVQGRVVIVDVWATWCRPCAEALAFYADLQGAMGARGFSFVGINVDEDERATEAFLRDLSPGLLTLRDPGALVTGPRFGISRMPTTFVLDRQGRIRATREGFSSRDKDWYRDTVTTLLAEPAGP